MYKVDVMKRTINNNWVNQVRNSNPDELLSTGLSNISHYVSKKGGVVGGYLRLKREQKEIIIKYLIEPVIPLAAHASVQHCMLISRIYASKPLDPYQIEEKHMARAILKIADYNLVDIVTGNRKLQLAINEEYCEIVGNGLSIRQIVRGKATDRKNPPSIQRT